LRLTFRRFSGTLRGMKRFRVSWGFLLTALAFSIQSWASPPLSVSIVGGKPVLRWVGHGLDEVSAQSSSTIGPGAQWSDLSTTEISVDATPERILATDTRPRTAARYYRLKLREGALVPSFDIGSPAMRELWVDPVNGDDDRAGDTRGTAFRTLSRAWDEIPMGTLTNGFQILITPGSLPEESLPSYLEERQGSLAHPISIRAADGRGTVTLLGDLSFFHCSYVYLIDFDIIPEPPGDTLHLEASDHILVRGVRMIGGVWTPDGTNSLAHDNFKVNQCQHIYVEDSEVAGADDNAIDFVAVQYGHVVRSKVHNCNDWAMYTKGGSAYLRIEGNEFYDAGTGGYTAGQGTGFQFMTPPWLHYEAYDIKVINNVVHDVDGAGLGVNGGYNVLLAYNTLFRVGTRDHTVEFAFGHRSCDGHPGDEGYEQGTNLCGMYLTMGGWGTIVEDLDENYARIPNQNIYVYNNLVYNPAGFPYGGQHLEILAPYSGTNQNNSNVEVPTYTDNNLIIRGNVVWNGPEDEPLGIDNSRLSEVQLTIENAFNIFEPQLVSTNASNLRPVSGSTLANRIGFAIPNFGWSDAPTRPVLPVGNPANEVLRDRSGRLRPPNSPPGAYLP
jgi:hypothetical protein